MGGTDFVTNLVHTELRNYQGHQTGKTEENSGVFLSPSSTVDSFLL